MSSAIHKSSLPPCVFPEIAYRSFWNRFERGLNVKANVLICSRSIFLVLCLLTSTNILSLWANTLFSRRRIFICVTNANFNCCVTKTPTLSLFGSSKNFTSGIVDLHSLYKCSASNPRFRSIIT